MEYPSRKSLSFFWNFGRILGIIIVVQVLTGVLLVFFYTPSVLLAFDRVDYLGREVWCGFLLRILHLNGASLIFLLLFIHISRGFIYSRHTLTFPWLSGSTLFLLLMGIAFLGYVLPWGQMSFWGATVITNLIRTIPIVGPKVVTWVWGGYNVNNATLSLFFALHYLLPFVVLALILIHLLLLHETRRTSSIFIHERFRKVKFTPYYTNKDIMNVVFLLIFFALVLFSPWTLGDPDNWIPANPMVSPVHIQPEWYFLFAYAILRRVPNKLGGVIALLLRVLVLYLFPIFKNKYPQHPILYNFFLGSLAVRILVLTWLGACPVEAPFILCGQIFRVLYFIFIGGLIIV